MHGRRVAYFGDGSGPSEMTRNFLWLAAANPALRASGTEMIGSLLSLKRPFSSCPCLALTELVLLVATNRACSGPKFGQHKAGSGRQSAR